MKEFMTVGHHPRRHDVVSCDVELLSPPALTRRRHEQMYGKLVQRCFDDCVNDFTTKSLLGREEGCVLRCVDKFIKGSERLGQRWQEQNAAMAQSGQPPPGR